MMNWEIVSDNHLNDRDYFVPVRHATAGTFSFPGFAFNFEKTPLSIRNAAPAFAEHNLEVFGELLGCSESDVQDLAAEGVTGFAPIYAAGPAL